MHLVVPRERAASAVIANSGSNGRGRIRFMAFVNADSGETAAELAAHLRIHLPHSHSRSP